MKHTYRARAVPQSTSEIPPGGSETPARNPSVRYERAQPSVTALVFASVSLAAALIFVFLISAALLSAFRPRYAAQSAPALDFSNSPPEPRLQAAPEADLANLQREQRARIQSYGWVDRRHGVVRIPVDRAMDLLVGENGRQGQGGAP